MNQFTNFNAASPSERVERWEQCLRVLEGLSEHERQHHWNMARWGIETECGTVCCAAGHCALDSWFTDRGFKLYWETACTCSGCQEFPHTKAASLYPDSFFGSTGTDRIFAKTAARPVEAVIEEVKQYIAELRTDLREPL